MTNINLLKHLVKEYGIELTDLQLEQFDVFYQMLIEWNGKMNLTAITDKEQVIYKHFADSLMLAKFIDLNNSLEIIDVGTGAGFPGIPLKIAFPKLKITLLDSLNKRINFLDNVIDKLRLADIVTIHGRAEELGRDKEYRERFDIAVSRAVANLTVLSEYCIPFVKEKGLFISYKAGDCDEEIKNSKKMIRTLGGRIENKFQAELTGIDKVAEQINRCFIFIRKDELTADKYPRRPAAIKKHS